MARQSLGDTTGDTKGGTARKGRRRRARTQHTGVKLKRRSSGTWVARWRDPMSGAETQQSLDALGLTTDDARRAWAIDKASSLRATKAAIASGTAQASRSSIAAAIKQYFGVANIRANTATGYQTALDRFSTWAADAGLRDTRDIAPRHLSAYRDAVLKLSAQNAAKGRGRGARIAGKRRLSPVTINGTLRATKIWLAWARRSGLLPHLDGDAIRDNLRPVKVAREAVAILRPADVRALLLAAQRHDAETFDMTREEHDGEKPKGTTARYEPAAPFVLALLLSGMRLSEMAGLRWAEVDLPAGEIRLGAGRTKTGHARSVTLAETPTLAALLGALRLRTPGDRVWPTWTKDLAKSTQRRLLQTFGAPSAFTWQTLRRTCAAVLTNAPGIYGAASAFRSAKRAGHSVVIAEKHYVDVLRDLPATATTLEDAVGIRSIADAIVAQVFGDVAAKAAAE